MFIIFVVGNLYYKPRIINSFEYPAHCRRRLSRLDQSERWFCALGRSLSDTTKFSWCLKFSTKPYAVCSTITAPIFSLGGLFRHKFCYSSTVQIFLAILVYAMQIVTASLIGRPPVVPHRFRLPGQSGGRSHSLFHNVRDPTECLISSNYLSQF